MTYLNTKSTTDGLALVLSGGGARAAYQVGFLSALAKRCPDIRFPIITGVSAGAINAAYLANHQGSFSEAVEDLVKFWKNLTMDQVFHVSTGNLIKNLFHWIISLTSGGVTQILPTQGMMNTSPLRELLIKKLSPVEGVLTGISKNLQKGHLKAFAVTGTSYATGQSITWIQGKNIELWERPRRRSIKTDITIDHIMSSAALPILFPAVQVKTSWFGDGGIRQSAPLSPALHLGAEKILAISTGFQPSIEEADAPVITGYPPLAQIIGILFNSIFTTALDQDERTLEQMNRFLEKIPGQHQPGFRKVQHFVLHPSQDLAKMAGQYEAQLPPMFLFLTRGFGMHMTKRPDWLSMIMFNPQYIKRLIEIGKTDADARIPEIAALIE